MFQGKNQRKSFFQINHLQASYLKDINILMFLFLQRDILHKCELNHRNILNPSPLLYISPLSSVNPKSLPVSKWMPTITFVWLSIYWRGLAPGADSTGIKDISLMALVSNSSPSVTTVSLMGFKKTYLHHQLVSSGHQREAIGIIKSLRNILAKGVTSSPRRYPPATTVIWIWPRQVTHWTLMWNYL